MGHLRRSTLGRSWHYTWKWLGPVRRRLLISPFLASSLTAVETLVLLVAARLLLGFVQGDDTIDLGVPGVGLLTFNEVCFVGLGLVLITAVIRYLYSRYTAWLAAVAVRSARQTVLDAALHTPWERQRSQRAGELQRLLATNGIAASVPVVNLAVVLNAGSVIAVYFTIVAVSSPRLLLIMVALMVVLLLGFSPLRTMTKTRASQYARAIGELQLDSSSFSALKREFELYAVQDESFSQLRRSNASVATAFGQRLFLFRFVPALYQLALIAGIVAALAVARSVDLTVAGVSTAAVLLLRSMTYVQQLNSSAQTALGAFPLLDEIDDYVAQGHTSRRTFGTETLSSVETIELRDVSFTYEGSEHAIRDVNLVLRAGDQVGIVGSSGGGKSTLANLLVRLTDPTIGAAVVNGRPIEAYDRQSWAEQVGFVGQEPLLLRGTIAENVRLFRQASVEDVESSLAKANVLEEFQVLPAGLDTMVGEGANALSGGQRQRLGIARALLTKPSLLVLDEPSSALDAESERQIDVALQNLDPNAIVVIISHRQTLLERCGRLLRVHDGRVTEDLTRTPIVRGELNVAAD